jgi:hypothetical protein
MSRLILPPRLARWRFSLLPGSPDGRSVCLVQASESVGYITFVLKFEKPPFLALRTLCAGGLLVCDRLGTLEGPFVREHCEYYGVPIKGAQPKHRTYADTGPAKQFLRKQRGYAPHLFQSRRQSRPFARSGFSHLLIVSQVLLNSLGTRRPAFGFFDPVLNQARGGDINVVCRQGTRTNLPTHRSESFLDL